MTSSPVAAWSAADWEPLPDSQFDADAARHLLRRAGWAALPGDVDRAVRQGLSATLDELFPARAPSFPKTALIQKLEGDEAQIAARIRTTVDDVSKRQLRKELRDRSQQVYQDLVIKWLQFAADPAHAATENGFCF